MNTATQDVFVDPDHEGDVYGPERVGSGRVEVAGAVDTTTLAYVKDTPGAVSVSFGPVAVTAADHDADQDRARSSTSARPARRPTRSATRPRTRRRA